MNVNLFLNGQHYVVNTSSGHHTLNFGGPRPLTLVTTSQYVSGWIDADSPEVLTPRSGVDGWTQVTLFSQWKGGTTHAEIRDYDFNYSGTMATTVFDLNTEVGMSFDPWWFTSTSILERGQFYIQGPLNGDNSDYCSFVLESCSTYDSLAWEHDANLLASNLGLNTNDLQQFEYILKFTLVNRTYNGEVIYPNADDAAALDSLTLYFGVDANNVLVYLGELYLDTVNGAESWTTTWDPPLLNPDLTTLQILVY